MTIYKLNRHTNYQDVKINGVPTRLNFGLCYIEEVLFDSDFEAGKYVGGIPNKSILFTDKTEAYLDMARQNDELCKALLNALEGKGEN